MGRGLLVFGLLFLVLPLLGLLAAPFVTGASLWLPLVCVLLLAVGLVVALPFADVR